MENINKCKFDCDVLVRLERELAEALKSKEHLCSEWRKYRYALNAIAYPNSWGVIPGSEIEIASRALLIGLDIDPVPESTKIKKSEDQKNKGK